VPAFNKHIIIVGSARSGTSWLAETIAKQHRYRLLFEPDHEFQTKKGALICDKWMDDFKDAPEAFNYLKKVFANRVDNDWIAQNSNRKWKRHLWPGIPLKFVIKFVRTNLMASAMHKEFGIPVVHIIRNPYDTIASQHRVKFPWLYDLSHFQKQENLVALIKEQFGFDIKDVSSFTELEKLTIRWCIENVIPIELWKVKGSNYRVIRYEDLKADIKLFKELCDDFSLKPIENLASVYANPSSKTHPKSNIISKQEKTELFSHQDYEKINRILKLFKTNLYPLKEI